MYVTLWLRHLGQCCSPAVHRRTRHVDKETHTVCGAMYAGTWTAACTCYSVPQHLTTAYWARCAWPYADTEMAMHRLCMQQSARQTAPCRVRSTRSTSTQRVAEYMPTACSPPLHHTLHPRSTWHPTPHSIYARTLCATRRVRSGVLSLCSTHAHPPSIPIVQEYEYGLQHIHPLHPTLHVYVYA